MKANIELAKELGTTQEVVQAIRADTLEECLRITTNAEAKDISRWIVIMAERNEKGEL